MAKFFLTGIWLTILGLLIASFVGMLFFSHAAQGLGITAFIVLFVWVLSKHGTRPFDLKTSLPSRVVFVLALLAFILSMFLAGGRGFPRPGKAPILAERSHYTFYHSSHEPRWRFVWVSLLFNFAWHGGIFAFAFEFGRRTIGDLDSNTDPGG